MSLIAYGIAGRSSIAGCGATGCVRSTRRDRVQCRPVGLKTERVDFAVREERRRLEIAREQIDLGGNRLPPVACADAAAGVVGIRVRDEHVRRAVAVVVEAILDL